MAMGSSPLFLIHHPPHTIKKTSTRISMLATQNTSSSLIQIGSSINIQKVFEDKSRGIVCYLDDKGEITCEGYDEGPRFATLHHHQTFSPTYNQSTSQQDILRLLNRSLLLQVIDAAAAAAAGNPN
ncbi:hypothetical protein Ccrd_005070 [Cynara cardunculus var. scolymus]|uniref:Uncharacterized protein n=1 Tax=Cynara cardunculus var. scolymus TaxID=59895 RepID=A0A103XLG4_CYNCS|nr:hypothetical protein Ccrd_005070 [Cynara cardunculus var. scolymus]